MNKRKEASTNRTALTVRLLMNPVRLSNGLLVATAFAYGGGTVLVIAGLGGAAFAWGLLGAIVGLAALAFVAGAIRPEALGRTGVWRHKARDEWAEHWEELMSRPVR